MSRLVAVGGVPGQYRVDYMLQDFGDFNVSITLAGRHIKGSPFRLRMSKKLPPIPSSGFFSTTATKITVSVSLLNPRLYGPYETQLKREIGFKEPSAHPAENPNWIVVQVYFNSVSGERFSTNRAGQMGHHPCTAEFSAETVAMLGEGAYL
jgi:hypothetical protein